MTKLTGFSACGGGKKHRFPPPQFVLCEGFLSGGLSPEKRSLTHKERIRNQEEFTLDTARKEETLQECPCRHKHRDPKEEKDLISRLNRIEGQVRGIKAMVQDDRYCTDILVQVSAVQSALNGFSKVLLSNHIKTCVVEDIKNGKEDQAIHELCETIKKMM